MKPIFTGDHYRMHDYGNLNKHVGISYECKQCRKQFVDEAACKEHIETAGHQTAPGAA